MLLLINGIPSPKAKWSRVIIPKTIKIAGLSKESINIFCATCGPGLIGGLLVGSTVAKAMAVASNKPFYPINHLEGHALSAQINDEVSFPFLLLLIMFLKEKLIQMMIILAKRSNHGFDHDFYQLTSYRK